MVKRPNPKRTLLLNLRRRITRVQRRFDVEDLGGGRVRLTCRTCGTITEESPGGDSIPQATAEFLAHYWAGKAAGGIGGNCETCLKHERDARYPLP